LIHRAALIVLAGLAGHVAAADALDALEAKDPVVEATKAFAAGDRRHIVVPVCGKEPGEVIPGWPLDDSTRVQKAMNGARRPLSCADLGEDPKHRRFMRASNYAERYNRKLLELEGAK
jgi:hypothetical protein